LRSGAFAPDCPVVIFVTAVGGSFRFPRAHRLPAPTPTPTPTAPPIASAGHRGGRGVWHFCPGPGGVKEFAGPPKTAARAAFFGVQASCGGTMTLRACRDRVAHPVGWVERGKACLIQRRPTRVPHHASPASALLQRQLQSKRNEHGTGHTVQTAHHGGAGQPSCQWAGGGDEKGEPEHAQERMDGRQQ